MKPYLFKTDQIGISNEGIHILTSKYNHEMILFSEINEIIIKKGMRVGSWILLSFLGVSLFLFGIIYGVKFMEEYLWGKIINVIYIEKFLLPIFSFLQLGSLFIYSFFNIGLVLKIKYGNKTKNFSIEQLRKKPGIKELKKFFNSNYLTRMCFKNSN